MYTPFWYNQPSILYDRKYLFEFFPMKQYDLIRKLNAIIRFTIYYSLLFLITMYDLLITIYYLLIAIAKPNFLL